jgi:hypothetical protein
MPRERDASMLNPAALFELLSEFILLLLGALLVLLAVTRTLAFPSHPAVWIALGVLLVYRGLRAWMKPDDRAGRRHAAIRAISLAIVGLVVIGIPLLPLRHEAILLGFAGGVLVLRGILGIFLLARAQ